ncbi:hypothetical protein GOODEAATRI_021808 [Goodea atripinnis]|uniref:Uncharacterized protein n=1 Tax=Goodea atripinnis TaxID=208336 RepID=A0ABV0Q003_9TELE
MCRGPLPLGLEDSRWMVFNLNSLRDKFWMGKLPYGPPRPEGEFAPFPGKPAYESIGGLALAKAIQHYRKYIGNTLVCCVQSRHKTIVYVSAPSDKFMLAYACIHSTVTLTFHQLCRSDLPASEQHSCLRLRPELYAVCSRIFRQVLPELFSVLKYIRGVCAKDKDYLKVDPDRVRLIWHMDSNGIHSSLTKRLSIGLMPGLLHAPKEWADEQCPTTDTEGIVEGASFCRETWCYEFHVMGSHSRTLYTAAPSTWDYMNWSVTSYLLACLLAMNTYDCQGSSMQGHTLYHPPKCFLMSPIKPSMYVALRRVFRREDIKLTNCGFTERIGQVEFYPERLVTYRTRTTSTRAPVALRWTLGQARHSLRSGLR